VAAFALAEVIWVILRRPCGEKHQSNSSSWPPNRQHSIPTILCRGESLGTATNGSPNAAPFCQQWNIFETAAQNIDPPLAARLHGHQRIDYRTPVTGKPECFGESIDVCGLQR
jgi:hypothetical protein